VSRLKGRIAYIWVTEVRKRKIAIHSASFKRDETEIVRLHSKIEGGASSDSSRAPADG